MERRGIQEKERRTKPVIDIINEERSDIERGEGAKNQRKEERKRGGEK
jgi:hypothetical protein